MPTAQDDEIRKILELGGPIQHFGKGSDTGSASAGNGGGGGGGESWWEPATKGFVGSLEGLNDAAMNALPFTKPVAKVLDMIPGVQSTQQNIRNWAESGTEQEGPLQTAERFAGGAAPFMLQPELGLEGLAARAAVKAGIRPVTRAAAGRFAANPTYRFAKGAGRIAEGALPSAEAGAAQDPNHPFEGAASGAVGGAIPGAVGAGGRIVSGTLAHLAGHQAARLAGHVAGHGMPHGFILWPAYVGGRTAFHWVANRLGRIVGYLPPGARRMIPVTGRFGRAVGGEAGGDVSRAIHSREYGPTAWMSEHTDESNQDQAQTGGGQAESGPAANQ